MGIVADRVRESTTTTGTGNVTLNGTSTGYRTLNTAIGVGPRVYYAIVHQSADEWEVGEGYLTSSTTLVRDVVYSSTNSNALVSFSSGTKDVFVTFPAEQIMDKGTGFALRMNLANP